MAGGLGGVDVSWGENSALSCPCPCLHTRIERAHRGCASLNVAADTPPGAVSGAPIDTQWVDGILPASKCALTFYTLSFDGYILVRFAACRAFYEYSSV